MRWLITGGTGFIGRNLVIELLEQDEQVIVVDKNLSFGSAEPVIKELCGTWSVLDTYDLSKYLDISDKPKLVVVQRDFRHKVQRNLYPLLEDVDVFVHLAALSGIKQCDLSIEETFKVNVETVFSFLEQVSKSKTKRFIFASSGAVFSGRKLVHDESFIAEDYTCPVGLYAITKDLGENLCRTFDDKLGTVVLRFSNVYGPYSEHKNSIIHKFIRDIIDNKTLEIYGDGSQERDFIFVDDVVDTVIAAGRHKDENKNIASEIFHISSGVAVPIFHDNKSDIIQMLSDVSGEKFKLNINPDKYPGTQRSCMFDMVTVAFLDWYPKVTLLDGIKKTYDWYKNDQT
jgi:nucleoside-diphosphate-sugar epimerase